MQATGFILDPDGRVLLSTYSTGAVGPLNARDAVGFIKYAQSSSRRGPGCSPQSLTHDRAVRTRGVRTALSRVPARVQ